MVVSCRLREVAMCLAAWLGLACSGAAHAADEEIQVYMNDINLPHQPGLELHVNDVPAGDPTPDYPGAESSINRVRVTPEWSYALDEHFELGAYLPLTTIDNSGKFRVDGWKLRIKWLGSHSERGFFYGLNYEAGRQDYRIARNPWNNEIKLIGGYEANKWIAGANINVDFALSGPAKTPADVQLATKAGYKITEVTIIGVESYNGVGTVSNFGNLSGSDQSTYIALDTMLGRWEFNFGVGRGYGTSKDHTIVKMIIGIPIGK
jgi:hypothetical protein